MLLSSCHDYDKSKWEAYNGEGLLEDDVSLNTLKFSDTLTGFIGGRKYSRAFTPSGELISEKNSTVIYKTADQGRTWEKLNAEFDGDIRSFKFKGDSILALNQFLDTTPSILLSTDSGTNWKEIAAFPKNSYVREFGFYKGNGILVALDDKQALNLLKISDTVEDTLKKFSRYHYKSAIGSENIYLLNPSGDVYSNGVIKYNLNSKSEELLQFASNYYVHSLFLNDHDQLFVAANDAEGKGKVLKLENGGFVQLDLGKYSKYSLDQIYVMGKRIIINANKKDSVGPIGVTHEVLISDDFGKSWYAENYPFPLIVSPAEILTDRVFISYQGLGRFQKRK
jgi:hypothetical protein